MRVDGTMGGRSFSGDLGFLLSGFLCVFGLAASVVGIGGLLYDYRLAHEYRATACTVVGLRPGGSGRSAPAAYVSVSLSVDGRQHTVKDVMLRKAGPTVRFPSKTPVPCFYDPADADRVSFDRERSMPLLVELAFLALAGLFVSVGSSGFVRSLRRSGTTTSAA